MFVQIALVRALNDVNAKRHMATTIWMMFAKIKLKNSDRSAID